MHHHIMKLFPPILRQLCYFFLLLLCFGSVVSAPCGNQKYQNVSRGQVIQSSAGIELCLRQATDVENNHRATYTIYNGSGRTAKITFLANDTEQNKTLGPGETYTFNPGWHAKSEPQLTDVQFANW
jgi:hypothetical protein